LLAWRLSPGPDRGDLEKSVEAEVTRWRGANAQTDIVVAVVRDGESRILSFGPGGATGRTLFQIGSISKVFTGLLLQRMVDSGALRMEATLGELIGDRYALSPEAAEVTLLQLVTHTSGLPKVPDPILQEVTRRLDGADLMHDPYNILSRDEALAYLADPVGKVPPGKFDYSNYGMGVLAHVMELQSGRSYAELLQELVFAPLGMTDSHGDLPDAIAARLIQGHDAAGKPVGPWRFSSLGGAGSITANAEDLLRFMEAEFDPANPLAPSLARQRVPQPNGKVAIAWMLPTIFDKLEGNGPILWHNGSVNGYFAYLAIEPEQKVGVAVLINHQQDITALGAALIRLARTQSW